MNDSPARPLALVTGASTGIGFELAKQFAQHGYDLVVTAEEEGLAIAEADLRALGVSVAAIRVDLTREGSVDELWARVAADGRPLAAAALNAGIGRGGAFAETPVEDELAIVDLNVRSTVHLAKHAVRHMLARGEGRILFTSSIAATMPGAFHAVYNASKSFVQSFALALRNELKETGVTVTSLQPGPTDTDFFERAAMVDTPVGQSGKDDPAEVARDGFEAMMNGDERVISASLATKFQSRGSRLLPDSAKAALHRRMAKPQDDD